jgi:hypothetical protein
MAGDFKLRGQNENTSRRYNKPQTNRRKRRIAD